MKNRGIVLSAEESRRRTILLNADGVSIQPAGRELRAAAPATASVFSRPAAAVPKTLAEAIAIERQNGGGERSAELAAEKFPCLLMAWSSEILTGRSSSEQDR